MMTVNIQYAKTHLSSLLLKVGQGSEVVIARAGKPVARLLPAENPAARRLGGFPLEVPDSFFEPLDEATLAEMDGGHPADPLRLAPKDPG